MLAMDGTRLTAPLIASVALVMLASSVPLVTSTVGVPAMDTAPDTLASTGPLMVAVTGPVMVVVGQHCSYYRPVSQLR